jgi:hypothetical protein
MPSNQSFAFSASLSNFDRSSFASDSTTFFDRPGSTTERSAVRWNRLLCHTVEREAVQEPFSLVARERVDECLSLQDTRQRSTKEALRFGHSFCRVGILLPLPMNDFAPETVSSLRSREQQPGLVSSCAQKKGQGAATTQLFIHSF